MNFSISYTSSYANFHFAAEETEMVKHKYPDYEVHRGKHQAMLGKAGALIEDYKQGKVTLTDEVSDFLSDLLNKHIVGTDQQYSYFIHGVKKTRKDIARLMLFNSA